MGVLVQSELPPSLCGTAEVSPGFVSAEVGIGGLEDIMSGRIECSNLFLNIKSGKFEEKGRNSLSFSEMNEFRSAFRGMNFKEIGKNFGWPIVIEFAVREKMLFLLQVGRKKSSNSAVNLEYIGEDFVFSQEKNLGRKASSMKFFQKNNLFTKKMKIFRPYAKIHSIESSLASADMGLGPFTVRFSEGKSIGLPRKFVKDKYKAVQFIRARRRRRYTTIIHEYMNVVSSFEMLIDKNFVLLEHVPGIWESNNTLQPDVVIFSGGKIVAHRFSSNRLARFEGPDESIVQNIAPVDDAHLNIFASEMMRVWESFSEYRGGRSLPVNVHAVWDGESDSLQCINVRPGFSIGDTSTSLNNFHIIRREEDIGTWDGISPIRVALRTQRGSEVELIQVARSLSKLDMPVAVDFGLLSHPAMVLRQYGVQLYPSYLVPSCFDKSEYEMKHLDIDIGNVPVERILKETPLFSDPDYHIVIDREPIGPRHVLLISRRQSPSVKDSNVVDIVLNLYGRVSEDDRALFFERGRAEFCTSGFTSAHEHFHVVNGVPSRAAIDYMRQAIGGVRFSSLADAYEAVPNVGEYCIFGCTHEGFWMACGRRIPKQLLRTSLRPSSDPLVRT